MKGRLILEDGSVFFGQYVCNNEDSGLNGKTIKEVAGEVIYHTTMIGCPSVVTDPACADKIVCFAFPLVGANGVNPDDLHSSRPVVRGVVGVEFCRQPVNFRSKGTMPEFLGQNDVPALEQLDTRALVRHIRNKGPLRGVITSSDEKAGEIIKRWEEKCWREEDKPAVYLDN